jgi:hypothetical protein
MQLCALVNVPDSQHHFMVTTAPTLKGFKMPNAQEARDERIRRLMAVLQSQYSGDLGQLYAARTRGGAKIKDRTEIPWTSVTSALQKRGVSNSDRDI